MSTSNKDPLKVVGPKYVYIRFEHLENPEQNEEARLKFKALSRNVLAYLKVDRNAVASDGKQRVDIRYFPESKMLQFAFYYVRPLRAKHALELAKDFERLHRNCTATLEAIVETEEEEEEEEEEEVNDE